MASPRRSQPQPGRFELSDGTRIDEIQPGSLLYEEEFGDSVRVPKRTCAAALVLLFVGVALLLTAITFYAQGRDGAEAFMIPGAIVIVPGAYATFQLYGACRGWSGYTFGTVPSYD